MPVRILIGKRKPGGIVLSIAKAEEGCSERVVATAPVVWHAAGVDRTWAAMMLGLLACSSSPGGPVNAADAGVNAGADGGADVGTAEASGSLDSAAPPEAEPGSDSAPSSDASTMDAVVTADTWANYVAGFFLTYCTSCHGPSDPTGRDYHVAANVAKDKLVMRCGVAAVQDPSWNCAASPRAKQFPIGTGPHPSDAERDRIVAWISAGEP
jgi:hypothetical protein